MAKGKTGPKEDTVVETDSGEKVVKSIINPKYKDKYKDPGQKDWLTKLIETHAVASKEVTKKTKVEGSDQVVETKHTVPTGVDVDKLFTIASMNNVDVGAYTGQRDSHGFAGRFRMTLANMLRARAKQRHGLFMPDAKGKPEWVEIDDQFREKVQAAEKPTHNRDGSKIVVAKAEPAKEAAAK